MHCFLSLFPSISLIFLYFILLFSCLTVLNVFSCCFILFWFGLVETISVEVEQKSKHFVTYVTPKLTVYYSPFSSKLMQCDMILLAYCCIHQFMSLKRKRFTFLHALFFSLIIQEILFVISFFFVFFLLFLIIFNWVHFFRLSIYLMFLNSNFNSEHNVVESNR